MDVRRILNNDMIILVGNRNEGKSMFLCNLIKEYKSNYEGDICAFGLSKSITDELGVKQFNSLIELESIRNSIIIIDELGLLFDIDDRKKKGMVEGILRLISHNGNRLLMCGVPNDFKRYLCSKAKCFIFRTTNISDMINGGMAKEILKQYRGDEMGYYSLKLDEGEVLCYDGEFFKEKYGYIKEFDTKLKNVNFFVHKKVNKRS